MTIFMEIDLPILIFSNPEKLAIEKPPSLMRDDYSVFFLPESILKSTVASSDMNQLEWKNYRYD